MSDAQCILVLLESAQLRSHPRRFQYSFHCPALYDSLSLLGGLLVCAFFRPQIKPQLLASSHQPDYSSLSQLWKSYRSYTCWSHELPCVPLLKSCDRFSPTASPGPFALNKFSLHFLMVTLEIPELSMATLPHSPPPLLFLWQGTVKYPVLPWCAAITLESVRRKQP